MSSSSFTKHAWLPILGLAIASAVLSPSRAEAQGGFYVGVGAGPAVQLHSWPTQLRLEQEIGYYFEGRPEGFFLAFTPTESFFRDVWILTFAPRAGYMFNLFQSRSVTFQLGPTGTIPGLALVGCYGGNHCDAKPYFHFSFSLMLRLLFDCGRIGVYLRPVGFEFAFGDPQLTWHGSAYRYLLDAGMQFHF